jgi:hypothetical protein
MHFSKVKGKGKGKFRFAIGHEGPEGIRCIALISLTSVLDGGEWLTPRPGRFTRRNDLVPITLRGGGPRAGLDVYGKSRLPPEFDPQIHQPVASRYTDWAIPVRIFS